jgi:hypothetical protein
MDDRDGPKIAATFYERLFGRFDTTSQPLKFPDLTKSAEALHHAANELKEEKDATPLRWVPFVHYFQHCPFICDQPADLHAVFLDKPQFLAAAD